MPKKKAQSNPAKIEKPKKEPKQAGRPTKYTQAIADEICAEIISGKSLRTICLNEKFPDASTVFRWLANDNYATFREQYARACEARTDALVEEIFDIADDGSNDWMDVRRGNDIIRVVDHEAIERSKLRVDSRKWYASKLRPRKYGEKLDLTSDGKRLETTPLIVSNIKERKKKK